MGTGILRLVLNMLEMLMMAGLFCMHCKILRFMLIRFLCLSEMRGVGWILQMLQRGSSQIRIGIGYFLIHKLNG